MNQPSQISNNIVNAEEQTGLVIVNTQQGQMTHRDQRWVEDTMACTLLFAFRMTIYQILKWFSSLPFESQQADSLFYFFIFLRTWDAQLISLRVHVDFNLITHNPTKHSSPQRVITA